MERKPSSASLRKMSQRFYSMGSQADLTRLWDHGEHFSTQNRWVFECAWEVANKVGGIYTVIRSKTGVSVNELGDQYILLGPYVEMKARQEIEEEDFPFHHPLGQAVDRYRRGHKFTHNSYYVDTTNKVALTLCIIYF